MPFSYYLFTNRVFYNVLWVCYLLLISTTVTGKPAFGQVNLPQVPQLQYAQSTGYGQPTMNPSAGTTTIQNPNTGRTSNNDPTTPPKSPMEVNLFQMESKRQVFSPVLLSPNHSLKAFTEVVYLPHARQTVSRLYVAEQEDFKQSNPEPPPVDDNLAGQKPKKHWWQVWRKKQKPPPPTNNPVFDETVYLARVLKPTYQVGLDKQQKFRFETLTLIDWSASGNRLLFKRKQGTLYWGLRTSDILVYDENQNTVSIYPELKRIIAYQWEQKRGLFPSLKQMAWDIEPISWVPGSDTDVLVKAYAYEKDHRIFLGVFKYNITTAENALVNLNNQPVRYDANGEIINPNRPPKTDDRPSNAFPELLQ